MTEPTEELREVFIWQHDETGRTCFSDTTPGPRWYRIGTPALCYFLQAREVVERLRAENEALRKGEFICKRCFLRKDSEHDTTVDF